MSEFFLFQFLWYCVKIYSSTFIWIWFPCLKSTICGFLNWWVTRGRNCDQNLHVRNVFVGKKKARMSSLTFNRWPPVVWNKKLKQGLRFGKSYNRYILNRVDWWSFLLIHLDGVSGRSARPRLSRPVCRVDLAIVRDTMIALIWYFLFCIFPEVGVEGHIVCVYIT